MTFNCISQNHVCDFSKEKPESESLSLFSLPNAIVYIPKNPYILLRLVIVRITTQLSYLLDNIGFAISPLDLSMNLKYTY
jgi:hypothetical protein